MDNLIKIVYNVIILYTNCGFVKGVNGIIMKKAKIISLFAAFAVTMGMGMSVGAFSDMPDGEMGKALENAVSAGLINGITEDTIAPYDNITRAQMATIITRAFCATETGDTKFNDVAPDAWYATTVSQAAKMGAFQGDDNNNFNPENPITFQETYLVISRVFGFEPYTTKKGQQVGGSENSVLDAFGDKGEVASWATIGATSIVGKGGWTGIDGMLKPTAYITRGEFAILMDTIVDTYIDEPGTYSSLTDGLIMVRCGGVVIDGLNSNHNLVATYGVDEGGLEIKNSTINGVTFILGGIDKTPKESENPDGTKSLIADDTHIKLNGNFFDVRVNSAFVSVDASNAKIQYYKGVKDSLVSISASL